jgi:hypothetical protein
VVVPIWRIYWEQSVGGWALGNYVNGNGFGLADSPSRKGAGVGGGGLQILLSDKEGKR